MQIKFDEKDVFTYSAARLAVGIHNPDSAYYELCEIVFADKGQVYHFKEMLDFILEKD